MCFSFIFVLLLGSAIAGLSLPAHAQSAPQTTAAPAPKAAPPQDKMDKVPDEYIEEATKYFDTCTADYSMNQYYNCECLSLAYLDERIKLGPIPNSSEISLNISGQCRDAVGAAGEVYETCLRKANRFEPGTDPEKYCACVTNTYIKNMNDYAPNIDSRSIVRFQTMAYTSCLEKKRQQ